MGSFLYYKAFSREKLRFFMGNMGPIQNTGLESPVFWKVSL